MAAPSLRIPMSIPQDQLKRDMDNASSVTRTATRQIVQSFANANREILTSTAAAALGVSREWTSSAARSAAAWAAPRLALLAGIIAIKDAAEGLISATREALQTILDIAEGANRVGVSPQFFQQFLAASKSMKVEADDLEKALDHAFQAMKDKLNEKWTVFDEGLKKITTIEVALREVRELFTTDQGFRGLDLFRAAGTQEDRVRAVLTAMIELQRIGQDLVALDLGEKAFGAEFVDRIRQGRVSAAELLEQLQKVSETGFSSEIVNRTKEVDTNLKAANQTLQDALRPNTENLVSLTNELKSAWAGVVSAIADAVNFLNRVGQTLDPIAFADRIRSRLRGEAPEDFERRMAEQRELNRPASFSDRFGAFAGAPTVPGVPFPRRRPDDIPQPKDKRELADPFDEAVIAINKHIAALVADANAIGLTTAQHLQLRAETRLLEAARRADVDITEEQIDKYAQLRRTMEPMQALQAAGINLSKDQAENFTLLSERMGRVAAQSERTKTAFQGQNEALRFFGNELVDVLDRAMQKGANFGEIMKDVLRSVTRELLRAAITGEGAFAKMLGLSSKVPGGTGGLFGGLGNIFSSAGSTIGAFAEGGEIPAGGLGLVGEHGPNPRLIRAGAEPIMVTPNEIKGAGGGNSVTVSPTYHINASGADVKTVERLQAALFAVNQSLEGRVRSTVTEDSRRRMRR